jgi:hypothetical protein
MKKYYFERDVKAVARRGFAKQVAKLYRLLAAGGNAGTFESCGFSWMMKKIYPRRRATLPAKFVKTR